MYNKLLLGQREHYTPLTLLTFHTQQSADSKDAPSPTAWHVPGQTTWPQTQ